MPLICLRMSLFCACFPMPRRNFPAMPIQKEFLSADAQKAFHRHYYCIENLLVADCISLWEIVSARKKCSFCWICPNRYNKFTIIVFAEVFVVWMVLFSPLFSFLSLILILCGMWIKVIRLDHSAGAICTRALANGKKHSQVIIQKEHE